MEQKDDNRNPLVDPDILECEREEDAFHDLYWLCSGRKGGGGHQAMPSAWRLMAGCMASQVR